MTDVIEDRARRFTWEPGDLRLISVGFASLFKSGEPKRDKYLSRLFGLFNEDVVRFWCRAPRSRYADLGRPTLVDTGERRGSTLDFALKPMDRDGIFVAEMKCELELECYRYLELDRADQIEHHRSPPFLRFLNLSKDPDRYVVHVGGEPQRVLGTILVWGAVTDAGRAAAMATYGFADVLSVATLLDDLRAWGERTPWTSHVERLQTWSNELFDELAGRPRPL